MFFRMFTALGLCMILAASWVVIGMAVAFWHPNPILLIAALVCLALAGGIEFSDDDEGVFK